MPMLGNRPTIVKLVIKLSLRQTASTHTQTAIINCTPASAEGFKLLFLDFNTFFPSIQQNFSVFTASQ